MDVQPTYADAIERNDVIHFVTYAGSLARLYAFEIHGIERASIDPLRSGRLHASPSGAGLAETLCMMGGATSSRLLVIDPMRPLPVAPRAP